MCPTYHKFLIKIKYFVDLQTRYLSLFVTHDCYTVKSVFADFALECCFYSQMKNHPCILLILRLRGGRRY